MKGIPSCDDMNYWHSLFSDDYAIYEEWVCVCKYIEIRKGELEGSIGDEVDRHMTRVTNQVSVYRTIRITVDNGQ